jgi:CRP-like cAMP-binding protein
MASQRQAKQPPLGRSGVALLAKMPLFAGLSRRQLHHLAGLAQEVRLGAGRTVVQYGSRGSAFFVIVEGSAKVTAGYSARALARLGPGDFFGELALLDGGPRTASVVAETPLVTIRIPRAGFLKMLRSEPDIAIKILAELSRRLRRERSATH